MAPIKSRQILPTQYKLSVLTRSKANAAKTNAINGMKLKSVIPPEKVVKRSAFGDLTNVAVKEPSKPVNAVKTAGKQASKATNAKTEAAKEKRNEINNIVKRTEKESTQKVTSNCETLKPNEKGVTVHVKAAAAELKCRETGPKKPVSLQQNEDSKTYLKAVKQVPDSQVKGKHKSSDTRENKENKKDVISEERITCKASDAVTLETSEKKPEATLSNNSSPPANLQPVLPPEVKDFDKEYIHDPFQASEYASDIFDYMKSREDLYKIQHYMREQTQLTPPMRALVVDWMVEVQENFEMNHESLYLAVKLVDSYLSKVKILKTEMQLIAAVALFIATKYDEQTFPYIEDFIYACDGAYTGKQFVATEIKMVKAVDFNLGFPLSYRFLRRYARCGRIQMPDLTLARFILELSLMNYSFVCDSDSKLAAAALLLALKMKSSNWNATLEHFSGYKVTDLLDLVNRLNKMLHSVPANLKAIKTKYSDKQFYEVALIPLLPRVDF